MERVCPSATGVAKPVEEADVLVGQEHVDEAPQLPGVVEQALGEAGVGGVEGLEGLARRWPPPPRPRPPRR